MTGAAPGCQPLRDPAYRARLAAALVKGIDHYFAWKDGLTKT